MIISLNMLTPSVWYGKIFLDKRAAKGAGAWESGPAKGGDGRSGCSHNKMLVWVRVNSN